MKNSFFVDESVKRRIIDSISENLTDSVLGNWSFIQIHLTEISDKFCDFKKNSRNFSDHFAFFK